jgi:hypothetical protein
VVEAIRRVAKRFDGLPKVPQHVLWDRGRHPGIPGGCRRCGRRVRVEILPRGSGWRGHVETCAVD